MDVITGSVYSEWAHTTDGGYSGFMSKRMSLVTDGGHNGRR
jgi:hypothetical protein